MKKIFLYSGLLVVGLAGSQLLPAVLGTSNGIVAEGIRLLTMVCLGFIMIHVGYEFEIDKSRVRTYAVDYGIAATAAAFPWIFCAAYFIFAILPSGSWMSSQSWTEALLAGRFAAPTSAGILFAMLAAAGLSATWVFRKARILAIFDDLDTVLLMIPLKMLLIGARWQLAAIAVVMAILLGVAWRYLHSFRLPVSWPYVVGYATGLACISEMIYVSSKWLDDLVPIHIEVLLPAFVLGCVLSRPVNSTEAHESHEESPGHASEQRVSTAVSAIFMVLVGLSMPRMSFGLAEGGTLLLHCLALTFLANLGKMFPLFCYRGEASFRERLALCIGMWPRGEVGAGVLVVSLSYGIGGTVIAAATLSLALNLLLTGVFILAVKRLLKNQTAAEAA